MRLRRGGWFPWLLACVMALPSWGCREPGRVQSVSPSVRERAGSPPLRDFPILPGGVEAPKALRLGGQNPGEHRRGGQGPGERDPERQSPGEPSLPPRVAVEVEESPPVRRATPWHGNARLGGKGRIAAAESAKLEAVKGLFAAAGAAFPPQALLLRGFKAERRLEVWAASSEKGPFVHVTTYEVCAASGDLGPKRYEGDGQVPEGFYTLDWYDPISKFHMGMLVSYPSLSDRILGERKPGGEIMIHGKCASVGCLALTDERIQELWVITAAARNQGGRVRVHLFPSRDMAGLLADRSHEAHWSFWANLKEGLDYFKKNRSVPVIDTGADGRYLFK